MMRRDFLQVLEHDLSSLPVQAREEALAFFHRVSGRSRRVQ